MATQTGSYLYYTDALNAEFMGVTDYTEGSSFSLDVLSGTNTDCQDLDNLLTLELNFWVLDGNTDYEYWGSGDIGFITGEKYTCENTDYPEYFYDEDSGETVGAGFTSEAYVLSSYVWHTTIDGLEGLTIHWAGDSYPESVTIRYYDYNMSVVAEETFEDSSSNYYALAGDSINYIQILANTMSLPYRMLKINYVVFGSEAILTGSAMRSAKIVNEMSLNSETLPASTLTFTFEAEDGEVPFVYGGGIKAYGKTMSGNVELIGTYYIDTITRKTTTQFTIEAVDAIGVLIGIGWTYASYTLYSLGFNGAGSYDIMEFFGISNKFDVEVLNDIPTGYATAVVFTDETSLSLRDWLQQALFALATRCRTDGSDAIQLFVLEDDEAEAVTISDDRVYQGITLDETEAAESAGLYYHVVQTAAYSAAAKSVQKTIYGTTVYDNMYYGQYSDETIWYSSSDSAEMVVEDCYFLSNLAQSSTIATRAKSLLYDFHQRTKTAKMKIVWDSERLGDLVTVPDPYGDTLTGHIQKMTFTLSNITAAEIEVLGLAGQ